MARRIGVISSSKCTVKSDKIERLKALDESRSFNYGTEQAESAQIRNWEYSCKDKRQRIETRDEKEILRREHFLLWKHNRVLSMPSLFLLASEIYSRISFPYIDCNRCELFDLFPRIKVAHSLFLSTFAWINVWKEDFSKSHRFNFVYQDEKWDNISS